MPTHAAVLTTIETRLHDQWSDETVDLRYENEARPKPIGPHIVLHVRTGRSFEAGYAGGKIRYRRPGWIVAQCFTEAKKGTKAARELADTVIGIYEGQTLSEIIFSESEVVEVGDDGSGFYQVNAKIYFEHDFERTY